MFFFLFLLYCIGCIVSEGVGAISAEGTDWEGKGRWDCTERCVCALVFVLSYSKDCCLVVKLDNTITLK